VYKYFSVPSNYTIYDISTKSVVKKSSGNEKSDCTIDGVDRQHESTIIYGTESENLRYDCLWDYQTDVTLWDG
jgi:hypothetical protein